MNLISLPLEIQQMARLGEPGYVDEPWLDYHEQGIRSEHIPELTSILTKISEFTFDDENDPGYWLPIHACRALAQLQAETALPTMISLLKSIDEEDNELFQEEIPGTLRIMCPAAIPLLIDFFNDQANGVWARLGAAEAMTFAALDHLELRSKVINVLSTALTEKAAEGFILLTALVRLLSRLKADEAAPLVEQAFIEGKIDESIVGDFEDFQVEVGLLEQRLTHPAYRKQAAASQKANQKKKTK